MLKRILFVCLSIIFFIHSQEGTSQSWEETETVHKDEIGFNFSLAMSGFGIGGFYRKALPSYSYFGANVNFFIMRDEKEFEYVNRFGQVVKANDINRLFFIPLNLEFKKRLFASDIEDNFRPHFIIQAGVIYGMNFPRPEELKNEYQFAYNFVLGFGADITNREKYFVTIRPQYRVIYFNDEIAQKRNHSTFEIKLELGGRLF